MNAPTPSKLVSSITKPKPEAANGRNGKIARLPKSDRDMINRMIDDNLPYGVIIDELGESGEGLNPQNFTNWRQGGYQDHLKQQALIERSRAQMEFAADMLKETGPNAAGQLLQTCNVVAATQMLDVIVDHGTDALKKMIIEKPLAYLTLLNTLCNMSNAAVRADQHRIDVQEAQSHAAASVPQQPPLIQQSINPLIQCSADSIPIKPNQGAAEKIELPAPQSLPQLPQTAAACPPKLQDSTTPSASIHPVTDSSPIKPNQGVEDNLEPSAAQNPRQLLPATPIQLPNKPVIQNCITPALQHSACHPIQAQSRCPSFVTIQRCNDVTM
jgi:hypothetical protein